MIDTLLSIIAPHHCLSCQKAGVVLCANCKKHIQKYPNTRCFLCNRLLVSWRCSAPCELAKIKQYIVAEREGLAHGVIDGMKFGYARANATVCAELLHESATMLEGDAVIVPVPTSAPHIRQRGFDHTLLIAKRLAKMRKTRAASLLGRSHNKRQVGAGRKQRFLQANAAFFAKPTLPKTTSVILLDDIITTGSTTAAAARCLQEAGYVVEGIIAVAHQPLEKRK